jgi:protein-disulfide isomerase
LTRGSEGAPGAPAQQPFSLRNPIKTQEKTMNKGTAIVGFLMSFFAGMFLMWGVDRGKGPDIAAESSAQAVDHSTASVPVTANDPVWGSPTAPVTLVEISDFQCPFCGRAAPTVTQLEKLYGPEKLRVVWKNNPLPFHKQSRPAHDAAVTVFALGGNDAFWKFYDLAFANQRDLTEENFQKWATQAGVDPAKFKTALASKKYVSKVDEDIALARKLGATGTPAFRINGVTLSGAQPIDKFKEIIDEQLAEAKKLLAAGTKPEAIYPTLTNKNQAAGPDQPKPAAADAKPTPEEDDNTVWKVPVESDDPVRGPSDALVTMVVFSDFQCPFCKRVEDTLHKIVGLYPKDVRIVWKDNPLPFHKRAKPAALFARSVYALKGNAGFWQAHDALFESQPKLEDDDLKAVADKIGVPWATVKANIDQEKYLDKIEDSGDVAADFQARGTPHFFINGIRLSGAQPLEKFKSVIDAQIKLAQALVAKGTPRAQVYAALTKNGKGPPTAERKEIPPADATCPVRGSPTAKVTITEFSDFQCPFCGRVEGTLQQIEKEYGDKVKLVWRHMPLPFHQDAPLAAQAAQEVFAQKGNAGFWPYHDKLFASQKTGIKRDTLEKLAQEAGVDMAKFKAALDSGKHKAKLEADTKVAQAAGVNGTPAFVINGYFLSGAQPVAAFKKLIDKALKEAK